MCAFERDARSDHPQEGNPTMKWSYKTAMTAGALALTCAAAAGSASAAEGAAGVAAHAPKAYFVHDAADDTDIIGVYDWNSDGFTGSLYIYSQDNGVIKAQLTDAGATEYLDGTWSQSANTLSLTRPLTGFTQYYTYFLGGEPYSAYSTMFGGYYTTNANGSLARGTFLEATS